LLTFRSDSGRELREGWYPALLAFVFVLVMVSGCGPQRPPVEEQPSIAVHLVPSDLECENLTRKIVLSWVTNRRPEDVIAGYNIYIAPEKSLASLPSDSPDLAEYLWKGITYPGDTDPRTDVEQVEIADLDYGTEYFIHIRTVSAYGNLGAASEEIQVIPRPTGQIRLVPRFGGEGEGYSFARQEYVKSRDPRNDLYLFVRNDSVFAASPHRLDRSLRYSEFHRAGASSSIDDYPTWEISRKGQVSINLQRGVTYILSTPETCLAKFRVAQIEGKGKQTVVAVDYVFQPRCGVGIF